MMTKFDFLDDIWPLVVKKASFLWMENFFLVISKKKMKCIISEIKDYLMLDSVFVNVYDCDFVDLILLDFKESIYDFLHHSNDYIFLRNFKSSKRHIKNVLRDTLMIYSEFLNFEAYRNILNLAFNPSKLGGRKHYDSVLMQKITFLKFYLNKTDAKITEEIENNEAYQCFLGYPEKIPCSSTIWNFRERIIKKGLDKEIWEYSHFLIENQFIFISKFVMQDASFFETDPGHQKTSFPRGNKAKTRRSKDGTFSKKGKKTFFGYKIHTMMDLKTNIIYDYEVTTASLHDININLTEKEKVDYKDRGYSKKEFQQFNGIMTKSARNHPINIHEKRRNKRISSKRSPGERPYTIIENLTHEKTKLTEIKRAKIQILNLLIYFNIQQVIRLKKGKIRKQNEKNEESEDIYSSFTSFDIFDNLKIYLEHSNYINFTISTLGKKYQKIPQIQIYKKNKHQKTINTSKTEYKRNTKKKLGKKRKAKRKRTNKKNKEMTNSFNEFNLIIPEI